MSIRTHLLTIIILTGSCHVLLSQHNCDNSIIPAPTVQEAEILCEGIGQLNERCLRLNNFDNCPIIDIPGCPTGPNTTYILNNPNWFGFVASTDKISIQLNIDRCTNIFIQNGAQAILYELTGSIGDVPECDVSILPLTAVQSGGFPVCECLQGGGLFDNIQTVPGRTYYMVFDGCVGDICDIHIKILSGGNPPTAQDLDSLWVSNDSGLQSDTLCGIGNLALTTTSIEDATEYRWYLGQNDTLISNDTTISIAANNYAGDTRICVQAYNECLQSSNQICRTIHIIPSNQILLNEISLCEGDSIFIHDQWIGPIQNQASDIFDTIYAEPIVDTFESLCVDYLIQPIHFIQSNIQYPTPITLQACPGQIIEFLGHDFMGPFMDSVIIDSLTTSFCYEYYILSIESTPLQISYDPESFVCRNGWFAICPDYVDWSTDPNQRIEFNVDVADSLEWRLGNNGCIEIHPLSLQDVSTSITVQVELYESNALICTSDPFVLYIDGNRLLDINEDDGMNRGCSCLSSLGDWIQPVEPFLSCTDDAINISDIYDPAGQIILGAYRRYYIITTDTTNFTNFIVQVSSNGQLIFDPSTMQYGVQYFYTVVLAEQDSSRNVVWNSPCEDKLPWHTAIWFPPVMSLSIGVDADSLDCDHPRIEMHAQLDIPANDIIEYRWVRKTQMGDVDTLSFGPSYEANLAGLYELWVYFGDKNCILSDSFNLRGENRLPQIDILNEMAELSCVDSIITLTCELISSPLDVIYKWSGPGIIGPNDDLSIQVNQPGTYHIEVTDTISECSVEDEIEVIFVENLADITITADGVFDCRELPVTLTAHLDGDVSRYDLEWFQQSIDSRIDGDPSATSITALQHGIYGLNVTDRTTQCSTKILFETELVDNAIQGVDLDITLPTCPDYQDAQFIIKEVINGTPPYEFSWRDGPYTSQYEYDGLRSGFYYLSIRDSNNCLRSLGVHIPTVPGYNVSLGPDRTVEEHELITVFAESDMPDSILRSIIWYPSFQDSTIWLKEQQFYATPDLTSIKVLFIDEKGCVYSDELLLELIKNAHVYVPNAIRLNSPNEENKSLAIYADESVVKEITSFRIFDRWGAKLFERNHLAPSLSPDLVQRWDGTFKNKRVPYGVYVYAIDVLYKSGYQYQLRGEVMVVD